MDGANIFITRKIPEAGLEILRAAEADVTICQEDEEQGVPRASLLDGVRKCDVLLSLLTESVDREVLSANPQLLGVANMAVGFNNIDVSAATDLGVPVTNTPGVLTHTTADLTWALILAVARRLPEAHNYMVAGNYRIWGPNLFLGADVSPGASGQRKVLGVVGYGRIGEAVAKRAIGFDMDVLAYDPFNRDGVQASPHAEWGGVRGSAADERLRYASPAPDPGDSPLDRGGTTKDNEANELPHQRGPRTRSRRRCPGAGALRGVDRRRRPRRVRGRAGHGAGPCRNPKRRTPSTYR